METNKETSITYLVVCVLNKIILCISLYLCIGELDRVGSSTRLVIILALLIVLFLIDSFRFEYTEEGK